MTALKKSQAASIRNCDYFARLTKIETSVKVNIEEFVEETVDGLVRYQRQATDAKGNVAFAWALLGPRGKVWQSGFDVVEC